MYLEMLDESRRVLGAKHLRTVQASGRLGGLLGDRGQLEEAKDLGGEAVESFGTTIPAGHWRRAELQSEYAATLMVLGRLQEAETPLLDGYSGLRDSLVPDHWQTRQALERLVELYVGLDQSDKAQEYQALLKEAREAAPTGRR